MNNKEWLEKYLPTTEKHEECSKINREETVYIYFIKGDKYIKIGVSVFPWGRLKNLQGGNPKELKLLGIIAKRNLEEAREEEDRLHGKFIRKKIRGEWFNCSKGMEDYIKSMKGYRKNSWK